VVFDGGGKWARYETPFIFYFSLIHDGEGRTKSIFLPFICRLRFFEIRVDFRPENVHDFEVLSFLMGSLCISLTSPATLEHLKFNIWFNNDSIDEEEEEMFYENLRDADAWSYLDSITTHPSGSRLQRVDININCSFRCGVLNAGLPLLRSKGILFVKAVMDWQSPYDLYE
jgi:hypothetical protein